MFLPLAAAINQAIDAQPEPTPPPEDMSDEEYEHWLRANWAGMRPYAAQRFLEIIDSVGDADLPDIPATAILRRVLAERAAGGDLL